MVDAPPLDHFLLDEESDLKRELLTLNFGPQHPATHGTLRIVVTLDGETVVSAHPDIGFLHRGVEKSGEHKTFHQFVVHTDRLDYLGSMSNNIGYTTAVEKLMGIEITERCKFIRTIIAELARIGDHCVWLGTHCLDVGAFTVLLWAFKERERIYDIFESICGARLTTAYTRIGGLAFDTYEGFVDDVKDFCYAFPKTLIEVEKLLTRNKIYHRRAKGVGAISKEDAVSYGWTGPNLRATGVSYDVRRAAPYLLYDQVDWDVPTGTNGDVFDRYMVRMEEMRQSRRIIEQLIDRIPDGPVDVDNPHVALPPKERVYNTMEGLIYHFELIMFGPKAPPGEVYSATEAPNGELGFYIVSDGQGRAYRMRIRSPSFMHFAALNDLCKGFKLGDLVAVLGSLNIIAGELDR